MTIAINKITYALVDTDTVDVLAPVGDWIVDPQFDDPTQAFEVGPHYWVITGNNVHVMTDLEIDADARTVARVVAEKRTRINDIRTNTFEHGFFDSNGVRWGSSPSDIANINAVCTLVAVGVVTDNQTWRDADNVDHTLTPAELVGLAAQMAIFGKTCYGVSWYHKSNVEALTTVSAVAAYDITTGWPS